MCGRSGTCINMLESISSTVRFSFFTERELDESIQKIKNNWEFSEAEAIAMVEKASEWGISWAADGNEKKQSFLLDIEEGKGLNYLEEVFSTYQSNNAGIDMQGHNGYTIGSPAYMEAIENTILAVAGVALDALELGVAVYDDLNDADRKLGKTTVSTAVSIGTRWGGAAAGAKLGALAGSLTGAAAPFAIPILSLVGGIASAFGGDALGQWVVDITYVGE